MRDATVDSAPVRDHDGGLTVRLDRCWSPSSRDTAGHTARASGLDLLSAASRGDGTGQRRRVIRRAMSAADESSGARSSAKKAT